MFSSSFHTPLNLSEPPRSWQSCLPFCHYFLGVYIYQFPLPVCVVDLVMWGLIVCFYFSVGLLSSFRPLLLYDSDKTEGCFIFVLILYADVHHFKESRILDLIRIVLSLCCIKVNNLWLADDYPVNGMPIGLNTSWASGRSLWWTRPALPTSPRGTAWQFHVYLCGNGRTMASVCY